MEVPFIDIHTHSIADDKDIISCVCCTLPNEETKNLNHPFLQFGIHPWHFDKDGEAINELKIYSQQSNVMAIGEIGLDKIKGSSWQVQLSTFQSQINWASDLKKPLIIHCVKAYQEIIKLLTDHKFAQPVIFHGFYGSIQLTKQLIDKGHYVSFGGELFKGNKKAIAALQYVTSNRFFLETDTATFGIKDVYQKASKHLNISIEELKQHQFKNFKTLFPNCSNI